MEHYHSQRSLKKWIYPALVATVLVTWVIYMTAAQRWGLFQEYWGLSVTMLFGSIIAGATPQGGAAVAFPVFTKVFHLPAPDARTFGLMIQSVGMTMAAITILLRRVHIMPRVLLWVSAGGAVGMTLGTYVIKIPAPYPKILFTLSLVVFAAALVISRWVIKWEPRTSLPKWTPSQIVVFVIVGIVGGIFASYTGAGADALTFVVLTLTFGINEKISTPTTVIIMAINSLVGFFLHGVVSQDIGAAWNYWLVCVPIVIMGAPLGAFILSKIQRDTLIVVVLLLIFAEAASTVILIPFTSTMWLVTITFMVVSGLSFFMMLHYRHNHLDEEEQVESMPLIHAELQPKKAKI